MGAAATREYQNALPRPAAIPDTFEAGLRAIARHLRDSVADLTERETAFLYDLAREEVRYPMPTVRKLCALSRRSRNPRVREAFAELIRQESLALDADLSVTVGFDLETRATGPADVAQRQFERDRNPITYARAKAALQEQVASSELALLALVRFGRQQGWESK